MHLDEDRARMGMPAALPARLEDDALNRQIERGLGFDLHVPVARNALDVERGA